MPVRNDVGGASAISKDEASKIVSRTGWLVNRPAAFREKVLAHTRLVSFERGAAVYRIGDPPDGIYGLVSGLLRIELVAGGTGGQVAFVAWPGFWIGVAAAMHRHKRKVTVDAASYSWLLSLPLRAFEALTTDAEDTRQFASLINENNDIAIAAARDLMNPNVGCRVASRLLAIFGGDPDSSGRTIAITQADLAGLCNLSRKTINQELARLEKTGAISRAYGRLALRDPDKLARIAHGEPVVAKAAPAAPTESTYL